MQSWWREQLGRRPWWMNGLMLVCAYLAFVYVPWDFFFKPVWRDEEVWFGIVLRGWAAKLTAPLHWAIYLAATYGFWRMRPWMWPWAAVYAAQLTIATLVWNLAYVGGGRGFVGGVLSAAACGWLTLALWRSQDLFHRRRERLRDRYGEWALVTGASAGIGAEFARALAHEGLSCVLVARREDRLRELARQLESTFAVATRVVAADLGSADGPDRVLAAAADLDIAVLVNNAGIGYAGRFETQDAERIRAMVQLNCVAPAVLSNRLLPPMRARGRGAIIVVGSIAGEQPVPYHAVYGATKGFDRLLGEAVWAELQGTGVDVLVLEPGPTETEFQAVAGETAHPGEPAAQVVAVALEALGRQPSVVSGWRNWAQSIAVRFLPRSIAALIAGRVMSQWVPEAQRPPVPPPYQGGGQGEVGARVDPPPKPLLGKEGEKREVAP